MTWSFTNSGIWRLIQQSDLTSCAILLILFALSVICWAVFFYKLILMRIKQRDMKALLQESKAVTDVQAVRALTERYSGTVPGYFLSQLLHTVDRLKSVNGLVDSQQLQDATAGIIDEIVHLQESYLPVLSISGSVSPLLGLFGTVWGLIQAFIGISEQQTADIATVAPGIAEALITTLAGLVVAIPALVMFGYLNSRINQFEGQLVRLARRMLIIVVSGTLQTKGNLNVEIHSQISPTNKHINS